MLKSKLKQLKTDLKGLNLELETSQREIIAIEKKNNVEVINFIKQNMHEKIFQEIFIYDIYKDPYKTVNDYYGNRNILLNIYDVNDSIIENIVLYQHIDLKEINLLNSQIICYRTWIEHLDYVEQISKVNEKDQVLTLINLRIEEKKRIHCSGDHLTWLRASIKALEWARSTI